MAAFLRINSIFPYLVWFLLIKQADHQVTKPQNFPIYKTGLLKSLQQQVLTFTEMAHTVASSFIVHSVCTYNKNLNEQLSLSRPTEKKVFLLLAFLKAFVSYPQ